MTTIWRVLTDTDADVLDVAIGTWLTTTLLTCMSTSGEVEEESLTHLRLDGKTVRGAKDSHGNQRHLLAVMIGPADKGVVAAQAEVDGAKPRETITARDLLKRRDLTGTVLTADALHTVKATAELIRDRRPPPRWRGGDLLQLGGHRGAIAVGDRPQRVADQVKP